jgi:hypothetical protein
MPWWVWWLVWALGWLGSVYSFTMSVLVSLEKDGSLDGESRGLALFAGTMMALGWPLAWVVRWAYRLMNRTGVLMTDKEKLAQAEAAQVKAEVELRRAKIAAKAAGLPWPEGE